jgi:hypothetical protein
VLCPLAWLLGQTVPILTNLMKHSRTGEASGMALYWSTLGSFLGSLSLSLLVMQWLGVSAADSPAARCCSFGALLLAGRDLKMAAFLRCRPLAVAVAFNLHHEVTADTAYAEYIVGPVALPGQEGPARLLGQQVHRLADRRFRAAQLHALHQAPAPRMLLDELAFRDRDILVLGAGGFTLSHREPLNRYTYVDIDPAIRDIAEARTSCASRRAASSSPTTPAASSPPPNAASTPSSSMSSARTPRSPATWSPANSGQAPAAC